MFHAITIGFFGAACVAMGCSSSSTNSGGGGAGDVATFCQKEVSCGVKDSSGAVVSQANCEAQLNGWIPPAGCASAVQAASCADLAAATPPASLRSACFPACSNLNTATCSGDQTQITECQASGTITFTCAGVCTHTSKTYTGTCATTYAGQTSSTGQPVCWCK